MTLVLGSSSLIQERGEIGCESGSTTWKFVDLQVINPLFASVSSFVNPSKNSGLHRGVVQRII